MSEKFNPIINMKNGTISNSSNLDEKYILNDSIKMIDRESIISKKLVDIPYLSKMNLAENNSKIKNILDNLDFTVKKSKKIKEEIYENLKKKTKMINNIKAIQELSKNLQNDINDLKEKCLKLKKKDKKEPKIENTIFIQIEEKSKQLNFNRKEKYKSEIFLKQIKNINNAKDNITHINNRLDLKENGSFVKNIFDDFLFFLTKDKLKKIDTSNKNIFSFNFQKEINPKNLLLFNKDNSSYKFLNFEDCNLSLLKINENQKIKKNSIFNFSTKINLLDKLEFENKILINENKKILLFDIEKKSQYFNIFLEQEINDMKIHPDNRLICTANQSLIFYDICQNKEVLKIEDIFEKNSSLYNSSFSNNGYYFGCASKNFFYFFDLRFSKNILKKDSISNLNKYEYDYLGNDVYFINNEKNLSSVSLKNLEEFSFDFKVDDFYITPFNKFFVTVIDKHLNIVDI